MADLNDAYKMLPESAGVYIFSKDKTPIYIGKAINLKRRVGSYFDLDLEPKTSRMVKEANNLTFIRVNSELEALLLEAKLIKKHMPKYNVAAKDDKHPLYITITRDPYPRVITTRRGGAFGPFPSANTVRSVLRMIRKIFPYSDHKLGKRPCLYSQIGLCNPCPNQIKDKKSKIKYLRNIRIIKAVLSGKFISVRKSLEKEMNNLSREQKYEEASLIRNQVQKLDYITQPQMPIDAYMENPNLYEDLRTKELKDLTKILQDSRFKIPGSLHRIECFDVAHLAGTNPTASMVTFINGEADKNYYRHFKIKKAKGGDDYGSMREVAKRRAKYFDTWGKPDLIIVDGGAGQVKAFEIDVPVVGAAKNPDRLIVNNEKVKLKGNALNLVARIRNEAHRFARRYHHALISKEIAHANSN